VNDDNYIIRREFKKRVINNTLTPLFLILKNNIDITQSSAHDVNQFICENICSKEDFNNIAFIKQNRKDSFLSDKNRYASILKYSGLNKLIILENLLKTRYKSDVISRGKELKIIKEKIFNIKNTKDKFDLLDKQVEMRTKKNNLESELKSVNKQIAEKQNIIRIIELEISNLEGKLSQLSFVSTHNHETLIENYKTKKEQLDMLNNEYDILYSKSNKLKETLDKYNSIEYDNMLLKMNTLDEDIAKLKNKLYNINESSQDSKSIIKLNNKKIKKLSKEIKTKNDKLKLFTFAGIIDSYENYIKYSNNKLIDEIIKLVNSDSHDIINKLRTQLDDEESIVNNYNEITSSDNINLRYDELLQEINIINKEITALNDENNLHTQILENISINKKIDKLKSKRLSLSDSYNVYISCKTDYETTIQKLQNIKSSQDKTKLEIEILNNEITNINKLINQNNENEKINELLLRKKKEINLFYDYLDPLIISHNKLSTELNSFNEKYAQFKLLVSNYDNYESSSTEYKFLLELIRSNIIDDILREQIFPKIETSVNNILKYINFDEQIKFELINKDKKEVIITRKSNNSHAYRSGGFFYNLFDLVIKLGFSKINEYAETSFIFIDEIMDSASKENKLKLANIIAYLKEYYSQVVIISHDDDIKKYMDYGLCIKKDKDNLSNIIIRMIKTMLLMENLLLKRKENIIRKLKLLTIYQKKKLIMINYYQMMIMLVLVILVHV